VLCRWWHRPRTDGVLKLERAIGILIGAAAFGLAHVLITGAWLRAALTPNPAIRPWFTNSTGAVVLTAAIVAAGALAHALGAADRRGALTRGVTVGTGAIVAMLALLLRMGVGNLGPIVFIVGGVVLLAAGAVGGGLAAGMKRQ
jgi:hypothetical protein